MKLNPSDKKNKIRKKYLEKRLELTPSQVEKKSEKILKEAVAAVKALPSPISCVGLYAPIKNEVDPSLLFSFFESCSIKCAYPKTNGTELEFFEVKKPQDLIKGKFNIPEPVRTEKSIVPDLLIVPGIVFSKDCYRIGYGQGFYDRYLKKQAKKSLRTIGLAYSFQIVDQIEIETFDVKLDFVVTEKKIYG